MPFNLTVRDIFTYTALCSGPELCKLPDVELEASLLVLLGVSELPAVVSVDVITWGVSVGPSTGHVNMQSTSNFTSTYIHYMLLL